MSGPKSYELSPAEINAIAERQMANRMRELEKNENNILDNIKRSLEEFARLKREFDSLSCAKADDKTIRHFDIKENIQKQVLIFAQSKKLEISPEDENELIEDITEKSRTDFESALNEYAAACIFAKKEIPDCFHFDPERSEEFIDFLHSESKRIMNNAMNEMINQEAYKVSVETLNEMGYSVVGESDANGVHSTLMRVNKNIGINMITSTDENGTSKYTYEVVGITEDGHSVTEDERQVIYEAMSEMCVNEFKEFIRKIEGKGFFFKNLNDRSLNIKYCKNKNITDYSMPANENLTEEQYDTKEAMNFHS